MIDKIMDCIANPVKCKLLIEIYSHGQATAKYLSDKFDDIPQATLYRNLKKMLSDGLLKVIEETQVRGTVEKTYALAFDLNSSRKFRYTLYAIIYAVFLGICKTVSGVLPVPKH